MENITANLSAAIAKSDSETQHSIIVTTNGNYPAGFGLRNFEGLTGLYKGELTSSKIRNLAKNPEIKAIDLDAENTIC